MTNKDHDLRVLVVAPTGRDGSLLCKLLVNNGLECVDALTPELAMIMLQDGAGALMLAEEAFSNLQISALAERIASQPAWSALPIIFLTVGGEVDAENQRKQAFREPLCNVVLLERPIRPETLVSAVQAALRSRRRQYEMRDFLVERVVVEQALRKSEKLAVAGRLAASMAHEINNPLASVTNLLYLIGISPSLEEVKRYTAIASSELARVSEIVSQTLRIYRQQSMPALVQITDLVDSALLLYEARLGSAEIVVQKDFRECVPIMAVAGELRQLILNLVGNAMDSMWQGGTLTIRLTNWQENNNGSRRGVRMTIADTGSGIDPAVKATLFEPFVSTKGNTGTGLGLWVSSEIVRNHGGTIRVKSQASSRVSGTVFSVFLPVQSQFAPAARSATTGW
jgi:signal transduction histidine kinase